MMTRAGDIHQAVAEYVAERRHHPVLEASIVSRASQDLAGLSRSVLEPWGPSFPCP